MDPIVEKILYTAIGVIVPALITWLGSQIIKYRKLIKKEEDETIKKTIVNELSPIKTSIGSLETDIGNIKTDIGKMKTDIKNL